MTRLVRRYVRNQKLGVDEERYPNAEIIADYAAAFASREGHEPDALGDAAALARLRRARRRRRRLPDAAVVHALQRALRHDATSSDVRMGLFLSRLLTAEPTAGSRRADYLRELLQSESDPWTTLALPVLEFGDAREETPSAEVAERIAKADHLFEATDGQLVSPTLRNLRDAYDRLARFERHSRLQAQLAAAAHAVRLLRAPRPRGVALVRARGPRTAAADPARPLRRHLVSVADASRATLRAAGDAIDGVIRSRFHEHVVAEYGTTGKQIDAALLESGLGDRGRSAVRHLLRGRDRARGRARAGDG